MHHKRNQRPYLPVLSSHTLPLPLRSWSALHLAARAGNADKVRLLLLAQAPVSAPNTLQGNTPLHLAAINGHISACQVMRFFMH